MNESIESLLQANLDGELTPEEQAEVDAALAEDPEVRQASDELAALGGMLREMYAEVEATPVAVDLSAAGSAAGSAVAGSATGSAAGPASSAEAAAPKPAAAKKATGRAPRGTTAGTSRAARFPAQIAGYRLEREIARGGMGCVYRAHQLSLDRPVALKVLAAEWTQNEQFVARFLREARLAGTVRHANLVQIFEVGEHGEGAERRLWYSMELVEGTDAEAVLGQEGHLEQERAARIGHEVARALAAAAAQGIVHRDIKPANILLTPDGGVKLADLGLAKGLEEEGHGGAVTMKRTVIGSPNYMSPEQAEDLRRADGRSDVYSLGATLLHLITGELPFGTGTPVEILARVLRDTPHVPDLLEGGAAFDPALRAIVLRCLEKDPAARYQTAAELAGVLGAWVAGERAAPAREAKRSRRAKRPESPGASARLAKSDSREGKRRKKSSGGHRIPSDSQVALRRRVPPALWAAAAAAVVVVVAVLALRSGGGAEDPELATGPSPQASEPAPAPERSPVAGPAAGPGPGPSAAPSASQSARPAPSQGADPVAEKAAAALQRWDVEHTELAGERFRRAKAFLERYPRGTEAEQARALLRAAEADVTRQLDETRRRAGALEELGQLARARAAYQDFFSRQGEGLPGQAQAQLAVQSLGDAIKRKLDLDLPQVEALLREGKAKEALAKLEDVDTYAGAEEGRAERDRLLALARNDGKQPPVVAASPKPGEQPKPEASPAEPDPKVKLLADVRLALDQGNKLLGEGKLAEVEALLASLREQLDKLPELKKEAGKLIAALAEAKKPKPLEPGLAVAALFKGKLERAGEGEEMVLSASYDFSDEAQGEDWRLPHRMTDPAEAARKLLLRLPLEAGAPVAPWGVYPKKKAMLAYGHDRRRLVATFSRQAPVEVEVEASARENVLVALGNRNPIVVGLNYILPELPTATLRGAGEIRNRLAHAIPISRKRGPCLAILKEEMPCVYDELEVKKLRVRKKTRLSITWEPVGEQAKVTVRLGKKEVATVELEKLGDGPLDVSLLTLGSAVAFEEVSVRGRVSKEFMDRVNRARNEVAKEKKDGEDELDLFRQRFRKIDEAERNKADGGK
ncbi:MAG: protein kinase [Planctomycetota bacterium]